MKKILLFAIPYFFVCQAAVAQSSFLVHETMDINTIAAVSLVHGDMWWRPDDYSIVGCEYPKGSGKNIGFASSLWLSGYDEGDNLYVAAQTYRQNGNDMWPGPLESTTVPISHQESGNWARIWKVNRSEIASFLKSSAHTEFNTPKSILEWPGKGNKYARGSGGKELKVNREMAPFRDLNGNGIYEPLNGEYPEMKGDQMLWWVFNDNGPAHSETGGSPMGLEVHAMAYAYETGTPVDHVIYYDYTLINRSPRNYKSVRTGIWSDIDLGYHQDDYIGYDASHRMGIVYNGTGEDGGSAGGTVNSYGNNPPQVGVSMLWLPGDEAQPGQPAGNFTYFSMYNGVVGFPTTPQHYSNYMRGSIRSGAPFTNDYQGSGTPTKGYESGAACNFVFPGDPADKSQWSECSSNNSPGNRLFVLSSRDFQLPKGASAHMIFALIVSDSGGSCPNATFKHIKAKADQAWKYYSKPTAVEYADNIAPYVKIYPNPTHDKLNIETGMQIEDGQIAISNALGQTFNCPLLRSGSKVEVDVSSLPSGLYCMRLNNGVTNSVATFVKE